MKLFMLFLLLELNHFYSEKRKKKIFKKKNFKKNIKFCHVSCFWKNLTKINSITYITFQNTEKNFSSVVLKLGRTKTGIGLVHGGIYKKKKKTGKNQSIPSS